MTYENVDRPTGFLWRRRKLLIAGAVALILILVILLGLSLGGVLTPAATTATPKPATGDTTGPTSPPATTGATVSPVTVQTTPTAAPPGTGTTAAPLGTTTAPPGTTTVAPGITTVAPVPPPIEPVAGGSRIDCRPDNSGITQQQCYAAGCTWEAVPENDVPYCYVNRDLTGYRMTSVGLTRNVDPAFQVFNLRQVHTNKLYSTPFEAPQLKVVKKSQSTLNFKFFDGANDRYEVPLPLNTLNTDNLEESLYEFRVRGNRETGIHIVRKSTGSVLFDMSLGGLFLEDQFLQITTKLPSKNIYGFGDNRHNHFRHDMDWKTWAMFARDAQPNENSQNRQQNLYGVHPFFMCVEEDGNAFGVFLLNSNAMEYKFQPDPALTLRSIGGVFDFYIFLGPTPEQVVQQYTELVGRTFMPPFWGLGFQISRWGFRNLDHVKEVVNRVTAANIPLDAVYGDIDYMRHRQDFTYDEREDKFKDLPNYVAELHRKNMKYVIILDPAIHADAATKHPTDPAYVPYTDGVAKDIFIKWPQTSLDSANPPAPRSVGENRAMLGKVWPDGRSAFPDFYKPATLTWWRNHITTVYADQKIEFDALWLDMNEVSSFDTNEDASQAWYCGKPENLPGNHECFSLQCDSTNILENPPYNPAAARNWKNGARDPLLSDKTLCMVGETIINGTVYSQYNVHSLYGYSQAEVTYKVAQDIRKERSFVFSRSTYPGAQKFVGHWSGDNEASFEDLRYSLITLLEYNIFGYSYVGSDICGFFNNPSEGLCKKWSVVGAFYPFSRNHNANTAKDQDPGVYPAVAEAARGALRVRYALLPYLYTLFYRAHVFGETVSRPLHHVYPQDVHSRGVDDQFFWGPGLLISPILDDTDSRKVYLPVDTFYNYYDGTPATKETEFTWKSGPTLTPQFVSLNIRPGSIIPVQSYGATTEESRKTAFRLLIAADNKNPVAKGELFWDDGKSIDTYENKQYYLASFQYDYNQQIFEYKVTHNDGVAISQQRLSELAIYGPGSLVGTRFDVLFNGEVSSAYTVAGDDKIMRVRGNFPLNVAFTISFVVAGGSQLDCAPEDLTAAQCRARGCVFGQSAGRGPKCSYPATNSIGYKLKEGSVPVEPVHGGEAVVLVPTPAAIQVRPNANPEVRLTVQEYNDHILRVTFTGSASNDPASSESVPEPYAKFAYRPAGDPPTVPTAYTHKLTMNADGVVSFQVRRRSSDDSGTVLFDTSAGPLVYANQFREITTTVPSQYVYGIGEHSREKFKHDFDHRSWGMFARDQPPGGTENLYGVHPYVQVVEDDAGLAYGMLLLNAHAMEVTFNPKPAITYRTIGGNLDFFLILGEHPTEVNHLYMELIGKPFLPPYWALGFQISRYGYNTLDNMKKAVQRTLDANIPLDLFYGDIDYFHEELGFTIGEPFKELPAFVNEKLATGLRFVTIQDPCIAALTTQDTFKRGLEKGNVFIKWPASYVDTNRQSYKTIDPAQPPYLLGHVWPKAKAVFVDFFHDDAKEWWKEEVKILHDKLKFAALWIDMNEPANFGTNGHDVWYTYSPEYPWHLQCPADPANFLENPPYIPASLSTVSGRLSEKTICMTGEQYVGDKKYDHYAVHNLYGHSQIEPSLKAMEAVTKERSFVFSRSTFVGSGTGAGHWLGDNAATFEQLRQSVVGIMEFNMFGIPYVGADICGYFLEPSPELCIRWMQLGAWYPFSRNHNTKDTLDQDPGAFPAGTRVAEASKIAVDRRYTLLPYLYTLFSQANKVGDTVVRSLMEVFPKDLNARAISTQFMWGDALLISPVLHENALTVPAYFPSDDWYDFETGHLLTAAEKTTPLPVTLMSTPVHIRGGHIIPMQEARTNTKESMATPFSLYIAPGSTSQRAVGSLFWDGGVKIRDDSSGAQDMGVNFEYSLEGLPNTILRTGSITVISENPGGLSLPNLKKIRIVGYPAGLPVPIKTTVAVRVNGNPVDSTKVTLSFDEVNRVVTLDDLFVPFGSSWAEITFTNYESSVLDCTPEGSTRVQCEAKGCVWTEDVPARRPQCAIPEARTGYTIKPASPTTLTHNGPPVVLVPSPSVGLIRAVPNPEVAVTVQEYSNNILRVTFTGQTAGDHATSDPVPEPYAEFAYRDTEKATNPSYVYGITTDAVTGLASVQVQRTDGSRKVLFDTSAGPLIYANQYREITTRLPSEYVYGIGEHSRDTFKHDFDYRSWGMFARDQPPGGTENLYGVHPYVQVVEDEEGLTYGMLLLNAHAMEATFSPTPSITYRTIGGNLDFFLFLGENPNEVNRLYMGLIGKPFLPPYWALGFQISRYGYNNLDNMKAAVKRTLDANIPLDVFYGDIDYFHEELGFTIGEPFRELPEYVEEKLQDGLRFVTIQDPCIAAAFTSGAPLQETFQRGLDRGDVFIKWPENYIDTNLQSYRSIDSTRPPYLLGHVWPKAKSVFVDFFHPNGQAWWAEEVRLLHEKLKFAALWIDMNEPANFGTNDHNKFYVDSPEWPWHLSCPKDPAVDFLEVPPYIPQSLSHVSGFISESTICMTGQQNDGKKTYNHYAVHNLYGHSQIAPSLKAMEAVTNERSFVFSRSTFVGSGTGAGHWLGDNAATFEQLRQSVVGIMEFNMFGIPYVGADICGYFLEPSPELCIRWMQLGAWYPFSRNHNNKGTKDQDPGAFPEANGAVAEASKIAVDRRYTLLPYLYTLFREANRLGVTVVRSLMEVYPKDMKSRVVNEQFMWGDAFLISPILYEGADSVSPYFPDGDWYDFETGHELTAEEKTKPIPVTPESNCPVHVRGQRIIPMQESATNTEASSKTPYSLWIAPGRTSQRATGTLFWDNGVKKRGDSSSTEDFSAIFSYTLNQLQGTQRKGIITVTSSNPGTYTMPNLKKIQISGYPTGVPAPLPSTVEILVNGAPVDSKDTTLVYDAVTRVVVLDNLAVDLNALILKVDVTFTNFLVPSVLDCSPEGNTQEQCLARGCLWRGVTSDGSPQCAFPEHSAIGYQVKAGSGTSLSHGSPPVTLTATAAGEVARVNAHKDVTLQVREYGNNIVRITYTGTKTDDPAKSNIVPRPYAEFAHDPALVQEATAPVYSYRLDTQKSGVASVKVQRKTNGNTLFDTSAGPLIYADQFREITVKVPSTYVYGIGEHSRNSFLHDFKFKAWGMFARDQPPGGAENINLYGVHPYVQVVEDNAGHAYGMLLLNAHAMEASFAPIPSITYRTIGGNLDFFLFIGDSPGHVNSLYTGLIGRPFLPPYWALGFQISRYGYNTLDNMKAAVKRTLDANIPLDLFYGDIDYFHEELGFTIGEPFKELPAFVDEKLATGLRFVTIQDPCIAAATTAPASLQETFQRGLDMGNVFIKWPEDYVDTNRQSYQTWDATRPKYLLGHVWPKARSVFIDFFHPNGRAWWENEVKLLHEKLNFAALWIDMNEPANFGTNNHDVWYTYSPEHPWSLRCPDGPTDLLENPPYIPKALSAVSGRISEKTICMTGQQSDGPNTYAHYEVHNLYGHSQIAPSLKAMEEVTEKRSFVFSRSTFVGSGTGAGHWLGDNAATFEQLRQSVVGIMEFNMFGIPYVGADICGYFAESTPELCIRWMQLGAWYPFSRNHNNKDTKDQDPGAFLPEDRVAEASKIAVDRRYTLLPYLYTLFSQANKLGNTVVRSLMEVFPTDLNARTVSTQFMWGDALLITPVLEKDAKTVDAYFPDGDWYDFETGMELTTPEKNAPLPVDLMNIPLHIRGGHIIPMQDSATNTQQSSATPYSLWIAPIKATGQAIGSLFWDGGVDIRDGSSQAKDFTAGFGYQFTAESSTQHKGSITVALNNPANIPLPRLTRIKIAGYPTGIPAPSRVVLLLDGSPVPTAATVTLNAATRVVTLENLNVNLGGSSGFRIQIDFFNYVPAILDCAPEGVTDAQCIARGCLPRGVLSDRSPACAFQEAVPIGYQVKAGSGTSLSHGSPPVTLTATAAGEVARVNAHKDVTLQVREYGNNIVRITYTGTKTDDPAKSSIVPRPYAEFAHDPDLVKEATAPVYSYRLDTEKSGVASVKVQRKSTGALVFDTSAGPLIYANQFREISTRVPSTYAYGIGEHSRNKFRHQFDYKSWGMFARDQPPGGDENINLYGVHPYVQVVEDNAGRAYGMLLLNAHAMETIFSPAPAITYRTIGGNLDFFLFLGDNPGHVNALYTGLIGKPFLPPYWALGFQISRYGYNTLDNMKAAVQRTLDANIPLDLFYGDIDYFHEELGFTIGEPFKELPAFVDEKLATGLRFVTIQDPCIAAATTAPASLQETFQRGLDMGNVFIKWPEDYLDTNRQSYQTWDATRPKYLLGHVWPKARTVFVDFFHPNGKAWWENEVKLLHEKINFAALWIDMNEPANFGTNNHDVWYTYSPEHPWSLRCPDGPTDLLENPPYIPKALSAVSGRISEKTICMTGQQSDGPNTYAHYEVHNLYGHSQIAPSLKAMEEVTKKRSFVFSRSTFVGSGTGAGHWLGDNAATFEQLRQSVIGIIEFNMFGIPYVGADICGYFSEPTPELCIRWMQLGAFYPFSRNHNGKDIKDQDPGAFDPETRVAEASKIAVDRRYTLLPYLYTLFSEANRFGSTVVRSLMEVFPTDLLARDIDRQFMWGSALLITPVLEENAETIAAYFPAGDWYDFDTGAELTVAQKTAPLPVDLMNIPLHIRGGQIVPMQDAGTNTKASSETPYSLWIAPVKATQQAVGSLFWDGGLEIRDATSSLGDYTAGIGYTLRTEAADKHRGTLTIAVRNPDNVAVQRLNKVRIAGYPVDAPPPTRVTVLLDNAPVPNSGTISFNQETRILTLDSLDLKIDGTSGLKIQIIFFNYPEALP